MPIYFYRGDSRNPKIIFNEGFQVRKEKSPKVAFYHPDFFVSSEGAGSDSISLSKNLQAAASFPMDKPSGTIQYIYVIDANRLTSTSIQKDQIYFFDLFRYDLTSSKRERQLDKILHSFQLAWAQEVLSGTIIRENILGCLKIRIVKNELDEPGYELISWKANTNATGKISSAFRQAIKSEIAKNINSHIKNDKAIFFKKLTIPKSSHQLFPMILKSALFLSMAEDLPEGFFPSGEEELKKRNEMLYQAIQKDVVSLEHEELFDALRLIGSAGTIAKFSDPDVSEYFKDKRDVLKKAFIASKHNIENLILMINLLSPNHDDILISLLKEFEENQLKFISLKDMKRLLNASDIAGFETRSYTHHHLLLKYFILTSGHSITIDVLSEKIFNLYQVVGINTWQELKIAFELLPEEEHEKFIHSTAVNLFLYATIKDPEPRDMTLVVPYQKAYHSRMGSSWLIDKVSEYPRYSIENCLAVILNPGNKKQLIECWVKKIDSVDEFCSQYPLLKDEELKKMLSTTISNYLRDADTQNTSPKNKGVPP